jgi:hypothetical protein
MQEMFWLYSLALWMQVPGASAGAGAGGSGRRGDENAFERQWAVPVSIQYHALADRTENFFFVPCQLT